MARKSKQDWLKEGAQLLADKGEAALTIDNLTRRLGVTKGSFYHHFKSRLDFSRALLEDWEQSMTRQIITQNERWDDPVDKIRGLTRTTTRMENRAVEVAIRAWALRDPMVRAYQERVDSQRLAYTTALTKGVLGECERADHLGQILFALYVGAQQVLPPLDGTELRRLYGEITQAFALFEEEL